MAPCSIHLIVLYVHSPYVTSKMPVTPKTSLRVTALRDGSPFPTLFGHRAPR